jgi:hypothetical protein
VPEPEALVAVLSSHASAPWRRAIASDARNRSSDADEHDLFADRAGQKLAGADQLFLSLSLLAWVGYNARDWATTRPPRSRGLDYVFILGPIFIREALELRDAAR